MATLFFSYSHKDEALRDELGGASRHAQARRLIEAWHDRRSLREDADKQDGGEIIV